MNKKKKLFLSILLVSFAFQIVGTIANYQTVQMPITSKTGWWPGRVILASNPKYAQLITHLLAVKYGYGYPEREKKLPRGYNYLVDYYLIQNETGHPLWGTIFLLVAMITGAGYVLWIEMKDYGPEEIKRGKKKPRHKHKRLRQK